MQESSRRPDTASDLGPETAERLLQRLPPASRTCVDRAALRTQLRDMLHGVRETRALAEQLRGNRQQLKPREWEFAVAMHRGARGLEVAMEAWLQDLHHGESTRRT